MKKHRFGDSNYYAAEWGREAARAPEVQRIKDVMREAQAVAQADKRGEKWPFVRIRIGALRRALGALLEGER